MMSRDDIFIADKSDVCIYWTIKARGLSEEERVAIKERMVQGA